MSTNFCRSSSLREALDLPAHRLRSVLRRRVVRAEHHQRRPPPAVERFLRHASLLRRAARQRHHDFEALALMEALFLADAHHRARVRAVRAAADRNLIHDRRAVDQPADRTDVRPGRRRIVEDARVLRGAGEQLLQQLVARHAERFGGAVQIHAVPAFVLHLRHQHGLATQSRRAGDPVAFRQHADDLRMRVLGNLADERLAIGVGHPVLRLDAVVGIDLRLEPLLQRRALGGCRVQTVGPE